MALLTRIHAIADPTEVADPAYTEGLHRALGAAIAYGLDTIDGRDRPIPVELLAQARLAARNGVGLDTVLRRYFAGYSLLGFFTIEEASRDGLLDGAELRRLIAAQAGHFDRLLALVGEEHAREERARREAPNRREAERIERLLAGEAIDTSEIAYEFGGWHVGVAAGGPGAERAIAELGAGFDCRRLTVRREEGAAWAWLGTRRRLDPGPLVEAVESGQTGPLALGEPGEGLAGWRLTHRQAAAALSAAAQGAEPVVRYRDVALLASIARDELLTTSLRRLYLEPLTEDRDGGLVLRETLRAYFEADRHVSSTAASLGVTRKTVNTRLRAVEGRIDRSLSECSAELEIAVRLDERGRFTPHIA